MSFNDTYIIDPSYGSNTCSKHNFMFKGKLIKTKEEEQVKYAQRETRNLRNMIRPKQSQKENS